MGHRHESLDAWREAHALAMDLSRIASTFPPHERFELAAQLRRAARSIPANLAEGAGSASSATFLRHVGIALGSAAEVDNHLVCARDEGYISAETCAALRERLWKVRGLVLMLGRSLRRARDRDK
jgi:four helix bundle protein